MMEGLKTLLEECSARVEGRWICYMMSTTNSLRTFKPWQECSVSLPLTSDVSVWYHQYDMSPLAEGPRSLSASVAG